MNDCVYWEKLKTLQFSVVGDLGWGQTCPLLLPRLCYKSSRSRGLCAQQLHCLAISVLPGVRPGYCTVYPSILFPFFCSLPWRGGGSQLFSRAFCKSYPSLQAPLSPSSGLCWTLLPPLPPRPVCSVYTSMNRCRPTSALGCMGPAQGLELCVCLVNGDLCSDP